MENIAKKKKKEKRHLENFTKPEELKKACSVAESTAVDC